MLESRVIATLVPAHSALGSLEPALQVRWLPVRSMICHCRGRAHLVQRHHPDLTELECVELLEGRWAG